jgi:hypothetical protein
MVAWMVVTMVDYLAVMMAGMMVCLKAVMTDLVLDTSCQRKQL